MFIVWCLFFALRNTYVACACVFLLIIANHHSWWKPWHGNKQQVLCDNKWATGGVLQAAGRRRQATLSAKIFSFFFYVKSVSVKL